MNGVDLARFEFDYDTTWAAFFLDADLNVYSRYGGRDETSADGRHSKESLLTTMREVLEVHQHRQARSARPATRDSDRAAGPPERTAGSERDAGATADPDVQPVSAKSTTPEDIPLLQASHQGCVHCHQVQEYRLLQSFHDRKFTRDQLFGYPLPENLGIRFDRAHGHKIEAILAKSPAARAGLAVGDMVTRVGDVPVHSEQDVRWALHRLAQGDRPTFTVSRVGDRPETLRVTLTPGPDWRQTELGWRKSLRSLPLPLGFLAYPLGREERRSENFSEAQMAIKVVSLRGKGLATNIGLAKGDFIISLQGNSTNRTFEELKSDLVRSYSPGDRVRLTVLRNGRPIELEGVFPEWYTTDTSVP